VHSEEDRKYDDPVKERVLVVQEERKRILVEGEEEVLEEKVDSILCRLRRRARRRSKSIILRILTGVYQMAYQRIFLRFIISFLSLLNSQMLRFFLFKTFVKFES